MDPNHLEKVSHTILFNGINDEDIPHVLDCLDYKIVTFSKNEYIVKMNSPFEGVYIILEGEVAIIRENYNGNRIIVNLFDIGDICGEALAFCGTETWPSAVQSLTDSTLLVVHPEKILTMCSRACNFHTIILSNMIKVVAKKACDLNRKVEYLTLKTINGKLSKYLLEQRVRSGSLSFELPLNREKLADYMNISRPSMSRELCAMRDKGIIDFNRESFVIKDEERLRSLMEE